MTREQYIERVEKIRDLFDKENMMYELGVNTNDFTAPVCTEYIKMLAEATGDPYNRLYGYEIEYFIFEQDFGEDAYYADAAHKFYVNDAGTLYDYLMSLKTN